jgi:TonB-linked SusC/RagA family outer membrane protein
MKRNLCDVALMLSRYFLIGFLIQLIAFNTLFAKSGETSLHKATYKNVNNLSVKHGVDILKKDKTKNDHTIGSPYNNGKKGISFAPVKKNIDKPTNGSMERSARIAVSGVVSDENGNPLIGVSVKIKGTTQGTATDANGHFQLEAANDATLVFSYIGYENQEVAVNGQTTINVTMHTSATGLNEVVVVGYGTQKKSDLTGAVSSVSSKELQKRPAINIEEMLEGKAAGVKVSTNSGQPGGNTSVRIRGYGSINASNAPLYVVDGIVWTEGIGLLNPNDIQDIEVLKDASATAIYGTRGSNGVILVTTKRGKKGGQVSYNGYVSVGMMARKLPVMNSEQFLKTQDIAYQNIQKFDPAGWASGKYKDKDPKIQRTALIGKLFDEDLNPLYDVDYQDAATRHAISHSQNLSFTGGTDKTNYGLFLNYIDQEGILRNSFQKRYSARLVVDNQIKDWLKVGATFSYSNLDERLANASQGGNNIPRMLIEMIPIVPVRYPDGTYGTRTDYPDMEAGDNPVAIENEDIRLLKSSNFTGNTYVDINFTPDLDFRSNLGVDLGSQYNPYFESDKITLTANKNNYAEIHSYQRVFWQWDNYLTYNKQINTDNSIKVLLGTETQKFTYLHYFAGTEQMPDNYYQWYNLGTGAIPHPPTSDAYEWAMTSFFGRINYNYKDKLLFTATGRADGSSRFGADNKYAFFPSAAVAYRLSQEDFLKNSKVISNLKIRASYGLTGNSEIGEYKSLALLGTNTYVLDAQRISGTVINTLANPDLQWEKAAEFDVGLSLGMFDSRVNLDADVYVRNTKNLLLNAPIPNSSGYSNIYKNIGKMRNKGLELTLNTVNIQSGDFRWTSTLSLSLLKNKIIELGTAGDDIFPGPYFLDNTTVLRVGQSVSSFYGLKLLGTWGTKEAAEAAKYGKLPGDLKFYDKNGDGQINDDDRVIMGKGIPTGYGTFSNTLSYKNFDLTLELQYEYGNDVLQLSKHSGQDRTGQANSFLQALTDAWTPDHQNTDIAQIRPSYVGGDGYTTGIFSSKVEDGSFIRGKNLMLGYTFSKSLASKLKLSNLRIYLSAQNFFLLTNYFGYDPEVSTYGDAFAQGITFYDYPKAKTFLFGLNVSF